jgi:hypothetical protein
MFGIFWCAIGIRERLSLEPNTAGVHRCFVANLARSGASKTLGRRRIPSVLAKALEEVAIAF